MQESQTADKKKAKKTVSLKNRIRRSFYEPEAVYAWWVEQLGYLAENGRDDGYDDGFMAEYPALDCGDESIANCYLAMEQLLLLVAEKEGMIPRFSDRLRDSLNLISCKDGRMHEHYPLHSAAFNAAMREYGFGCDARYNWTKEDGVDDLDQGFLKAVLSRNNSAEKLDELWKRIANGDIEPEEIEEELTYDSYTETIYSITSSRALELERRYHSLPALCKKKGQPLAELYGKMTAKLRFISSPIGVYECLATETDYITLETGEEIPVWYAPAYFEDYEAYGCGSVIEAFEMAGPENIFAMQEANKLIDRVEKEIDKAEKKAKRFLHSRAVKGAKARWEKYREMFA
jgi:hypothetical protein